MTKETKSTNELQESEDSKLQTIFTDEEIRSTVKAFVLAYLRGTISVVFPTAQEYLDEHNRGGKKYTYDEAVAQEMTSKITIVQNIDIVSGTTKSTEKKLEEATKELFTQILFLRAGHRIEGNFMEFDFEKKLDNLELKLNATNQVVSELVKWLTDEAKGNQKLP